jgi:hypothetical protein
MFTCLLQRDLYLLSVHSQSLVTEVSILFKRSALNKTELGYGADTGATQASTHNIMSDVRHARVCTFVITAAMVTLLSGFRPYGIMVKGLYVSVMQLPWQSYYGILSLMICIIESLLIPLEAYRYSTDSLFNVIFK